VASVHGQVVELEFPIDTVFVQELLGIEVHKIDIKKNHVKVETIDEVPEAIDLNSLTVQTTLENGLVLTSRDAAREINVKIHLAPPLGQYILEQNYPNPFNPETWIPFALPQASDVVIRIYDATGRVIRRLNLGMQPAGYYTSQHRAAYWDGINERGERVASGVYFYQLQAGNFSKVRKMVILK